MKGLSGFKKGGALSRDAPDTDKQPPSMILNLANISNFNLVSSPVSLSTTAANSADSFQHPALGWSESQVAQWLYERGLQAFIPKFKSKSCPLSGVNLNPISE